MYQNEFLYKIKVMGSDYEFHDKDYTITPTSQQGVGVEFLQTPQKDFLVKNIPEGFPAWRTGGLKVSKQSWCSVLRASMGVEGLGL